METRALVGNARLSLNNTSHPSSSTTATSMPAPMATSESSKGAVLNSVASTLPPHFQQAQHSLANHRKNIVSLHRLHLACSALTEETPKGTRLVGEKAFNDLFLGCLNRVLGLKRGVSNADRVIKFAAAYSTYAQEHFRRHAAQQDNGSGGGEDDDDDDDEDTPATRFVAILLKHLLRGFVAKDKNVRLRCCQTVALLINGLESIDDDLYETLKAALLLRASDKEASVRVQAIVALAKLQGGEEDEDGMDLDDDSRLDIPAILVRLLRHDPSAEVRRAALFNLAPNEQTLPYILERLRDVDTINRRCLYLGSLSNAVLDSPDCPIQLNAEQWGSVIQTGLGEREASVVRATKKLIASWVNVERGNGEAERLLARFDVLTSPEAAAMALEAAFEVRPALLDKVAFDDEFWRDLSPQKAFVARIFAKHCKSLGAVGERKMEETMPLVTALAFRTQAAWGRLVEQLELAQDGGDNQESILANESIVQSLLHVSMNLDYGDEIGRRKMFGLVREMVSNALLPEHLINDCLDVLRKLSAGQKDFIRIIVEIAQEIEDVVEVEEPEVDSEDEDEALIEGQLLGQDGALVAARDEKMSIEEREQQARIDARRLIIIRGMLERMVGAMQENTAMHGLVSQLIAPAVRSKNTIVREQGLTCLGLCCLLDANLAQNTFGLFLQQMEEADGPLRLASVRVVFDNLTSHGVSFLCQAQIQQAGGDQAAVETVHTQMVNFLLGLLEDDDRQAQAIAAEGMAKLMLSGMVEDDDALRSLVLVYMSPETSGNQALRQCLSYFLPVYCYSSSACQRRLQRVLVPTLDVLSEVYHERESGQEMVTPIQVGMQLLDWSDHTKALYATPDVTIHLDVAIELLQSLLTKEEKDDRKVLCQLLGKLVLPEEEEMALESKEGGGGVDDDYVLLVVLFTLLGTMKKVHSLDKWDATTRNNLNRFQLSCKKRYPLTWNRVRAIDLLHAEELQGVRAFIEQSGLELAQVLDLGDDGAVAVPAPRKPSSRRSMSAAPRTVSSNSSVTGPLRARGGKKSITALTLDSDDEDGEDVAGAMIKEEDEDDFDTI